MVFLAEFESINPRLLPILAVVAGLTEDVNLVGSEMVLHSVKIKKGQHITATPSFSIILTLIYRQRYQFRSITQMVSTHFANV